MNATLHLRRTTLTASTLAAVAVLAALNAPVAHAELPDPGGGTNLMDSTTLDIAQIVADRKAAAAQYRVDHALEIWRNFHPAAH